MRLARGGSIPHVEPATSARTSQVGDALPGGDTEKSIRPPTSGYDWDRLEHVVRALVAQHESLKQELRTLREALGERNYRIRGLETQLLEANQRRQDTSKRIDELIAQLDQLDAQLASAEPRA
jgi:uncharacterized protein involved in exopolysaccharide biosynthesis